MADTRPPADPKDVLALREAIEKIGEIEHHEVVQLLTLLSGRSEEPLILLALPANHTVHQVVEALIGSFRDHG